MIIAGRFRLFEVTINRGGYDSGGAYWGIGKPLWCLQGPDGSQTFYRSYSREGAMTQALNEFPMATFYRSK